MVYSREYNPEEVLALIKQIAKIEVEKYPDIKNILYNTLFNKIPIIGNRLPKGENLYRTVPVYRNDISIGRKKYLSYRPKECKYPYFNRCSEPEQSHFYCSNKRHLSIIECSYFISEGETPNVVFEKSKEKLEVGMWVTTEDLKLADLRFGNFTPFGTEEDQSNIKQKYIEFSKQKYLNEFFEYINQSFEVPIKKKDHLAYWLTACYSNYLFDDEFTFQENWGINNDFKKGSVSRLDGILYHSVKGIQAEPPLEGFNLSLKTNVVDSQKIQLIKAGIFETQQVNDKEFNLDILLKMNTNIQRDSWEYLDYEKKLSKIKQSPL